MQSTSPDKVGTRRRNPLMESLAEHLKTEWEIYTRRAELGYLGWIAVALANEDLLQETRAQTIKQALEIRLKDLSPAKFEQSVNGQVVREILIATYALERVQHPTRQSQSTTITRIVEFAHQRNWFDSPLVAGLVCFTFSADTDLKHHVSAATTWLQEQLADAIQTHRYEVIADCLFGLAHVANRVTTLPDHDLASHLSEHGTDKVARALWFYSHLDSEIAAQIKVQLSDLLEQKINSRLHDWILPEFELAVFEGINLISTNLPPEETSDILTRLRASGVKWAKQIGLQNDSLVVSQLPHIARLPRFNAAEDSLAYIALSVAGRQTVYQLSEKEYEQATKAIQLLGNDFRVNLAHLKRAHLLGWINLALGCLIATLIVRFDLAVVWLDVAADIVHGQWNDVLGKVISANNIVLVGAVLWIISLLAQLRLYSRLESQGALGVPCWYLLPGLAPLKQWWDKLRSPGNKDE